MFGYYHADYVSCTLPRMLLPLCRGWRVFAIESNLHCTIGIRIYRYILHSYSWMPLLHAFMERGDFVRSLWAAWRAVKECISKVYQNIEHAAAVITAVYVGLWPASKNFCIRKFLSPHSSTVYVWILPHGLRKLYTPLYAPGFVHRLESVCNWKQFMLHYRHTYIQVHSHSWMPLLHAFMERGDFHLVLCQERMSCLKGGEGVYK